MGVRGSGPDQVAYSRCGVAAWLSQSRLADCCPCARPTPLAAAAVLRRHNRSLVRAALDQEGPHDAGHLVGQGHGDQHPRLAREHACQPRTGRTALAAQRVTARAPRMSSRRRRRSPVFETASSFCLPPINLCSGASPSQAAKVRPARKPSGASTRAVIALAATGPMPGIVINQRNTGSVFARWAFSASSSLICIQAPRGS